MNKSATSLLETPLFPSWIVIIQYLLIHKINSSVLFLNLWAKNNQEKMLMLILERETYFTYDSSARMLD